MACGAEQADATNGTVGGAARPAGSEPVAARRLTSVLFGDLVGFTSLSEARDQEDVRELLSDYFDACRRVVERYGGTVEKFIGDAVMAVWGVPTAHEDDAERAVRAGLEMVAAVASLGEEQGITDLGMRVGIVTGEVAVTIGAQQQGMVAGDAVNTAARVQTAATPGQVWVDETTRLLTTSAISYADAGSHALKGKSDPVPLWSVRAVIAGVGGAQRADGLEAPLVGRDRDLRLVKELFHSVEETGRPSLLVLAGEPGVGKSRVAWEFEKYVDGLRGTVRWHSGRCVAYGEGVAFFALAEAVRARLRGLGPASESAGDEDPHDLIESGLASYVPDEDERAWLRPRLEALLGTGSVGTFPREDLFAAWATFLRRVGEGEYPVVLVVDDAQHADEGLVRFVEYLLDAGDFACFVVLLSRPGLLEEHPALATHRRAMVRHLEVLHDDEVARLLDGLVVGLPGDARESLVARAEGVPLFAVETVRSLIDRDLVVPRGGQYVLASPETLDLDSVGAPASLHALVAARLDALDRAQRRLVDRACVVGTVFSRDQIAALCAELDGVDDVQPLLAGLTRLQIVGQLASRFSAEYGQYQFVQSVVRQVAYSTLSRRERRTTHLAVARILERESDGPGELAPIIAQHYLDAIDAMPSERHVAELKALAITHLEEAAERARGLGAMAEAGAHLLVAIQHTDDPAIRARLQSAAAWAMSDSGDYERAISLAQAATDTFDALGDPVAAGDAAAAHGSALTRTGNSAAAAAIVEPRWHALCDEVGADRTLVQLAYILGRAMGRDWPGEHFWLDRRTLVSERLGDPAEISAAWRALSVHFVYAGAPATGHGPARGRRGTGPRPSPAAGPDPRPDQPGLLLQPGRPGAGGARRTRGARRLRPRRGGGAARVQPHQPAARAPRRRRVGRGARGHRCDRDRAADGDQPLRRHAGNAARGARGAGPRGVADLRPAGQR